jgi:hypothetical protein
MAGCKDNPEQIPVYLDIQPFKINETGPGKWQNITEAWLYVNGEFLGVYSLPAKVPVLAEGISEIWVYPGVKENGINNAPSIYDFLTRSESKITLTAGTTVTINPSTKYKSDIFFAWDISRTTFDGASSIVFDDRDIDQATSYTLTSNGGFDGRYLRMKVDTAHQIIAIASEAADLPITGDRQTWLEINRINDVPFSLVLVGFTIVGSEQQFPVYSFAKTDVWKKIYINLTDFLVKSGEDKHRLYFQVQLPKDNNGKPTVDVGTVGLDNIRLVHF